MQIKEILFVVVIVIVAAGIGRWTSPDRVVYQTDHQQEQIDSLSVALQNTIADRATLRREIQETTQAFQERVDASEDQIASYSRILGELRLERDSLQQAATRTGLRSLLIPAEAQMATMFRDTMIQSQVTYSDSLFEASATAGIADDSLFVDPPVIRQLRPIRIDLAIMVRPQDNRVTSIATSPDFRDLQVEAWTELQPPKRRLPWFWIGLGAGLGVAVLL